jgi:hypothetical protein
MDTAEPNLYAVEGLLAVDHAEVDEMLRALLGSLDDRDWDATFAMLDELWARLAVHIRAENLRLFPTILRAMEIESARATASAGRLAHVPETIERLRRDHDVFMHDLRRALGAVRALRDGRGVAPPSDVLQDVRYSVEALEAALERHNRE